MFYLNRFWLCNVFGHKFRKVNDLRAMPLRRERVVYRCKRCDCPLIVREKDRRQEDRRKNEKRQSCNFQNITLKPTV